MIEYNYEEIEILKNNIDKKYDDIISILQFFKDEEKNIFEVIDTPKSHKSIETINKYFNKITKDTKDNQLSTKKELNYIIEKYQSLHNDIKKAVGEK